jgi:hypothetical protein
MDEPRSFAEALAFCHRILVLVMDNLKAGATRHEIEIVLMDLRDSKVYKSVYGEVDDTQSP